jgi:hypothetical protein
MADARPWYREPETFIAVAALVVSISAVAVGLYEAALQRRHDRAEVWPRIELTTFTAPGGATLSVENTGIGPALIKSVAVTVDGKRSHNWNEVLTTLLGHTPQAPFSNSTISESALRPGNKVTMLGVPNADMPPAFWASIGRVGVAICYGSVFDELWQLSDSSIGHRTRWERVTECPAPGNGEEF